MLRFVFEARCPRPRGRRRDSESGITPKNNVGENTWRQSDLLPTERAWGGTRTGASGPSLICSAPVSRSHLQTHKGNSQRWCANTHLGISTFVIKLFGWRARKSNNTTSNDETAIMTVQRLWQEICSLIIVVVKNSSFSRRNSNRRFAPFLCDHNNTELFP